MLKSNVNYLISLSFIILSLQCTNGAKTPISKTDPKIYFPERPNPKFDVAGAIMKDCVAGFCTEVENYPTEHVQKFFASNPMWKEFFITEEVLPYAPGIAQRGQFDNGDVDEETLCESTPRMIAPQAANNTNNIARIIVQKEVKQEVYIETCNERTTCKHKASFPNNYEVYCKQKFTRKRLATLNDDNTLFWDVYDVPCCCVCALKRIK